MSERERDHPVPDEMLVGTEAHRRASKRLLDARGSISAAFDAMECGIVANQAEEYIAATPTFQSLPADTRWKVLGLVLGFALTAVESDRGLREWRDLGDTHCLRCGRGGVR